jgi:ribosome maturation factor RimP
MFSHVGRIKETMIRGGFSPLFHYRKMNKVDIENTLNDYLDGKLIFLVDVEVRKGNTINVYIDSDEGLNIDDCAEVSRFIESKFDRDEEDYELRVSSPGLERPLRMMRQYNRYIGREINIEAIDNRKITGELMALSETGIEVLVKNGKKQSELKSEKLLFSEIRLAMPVFSFKSQTKK